MDENFAHKKNTKKEKKSEKVGKKRKKWYEEEGEEGIVIQSRPFLRAKSRDNILKSILLC